MKWVTFIEGLQFVINIGDSVQKVKLLMIGFCTGCVCIYIYTYIYNVGYGLYDTEYNVALK